MSFFDGYKREERSRLTPGDYRVAITDVEETTSRNGNPMLVVTVQPNGSEIHIKHYLVKNEYFNRNLTDLLRPGGKFRHPHLGGRRGGRQAGGGRKRLPEGTLLPFPGAGRKAASLAGQGAGTPRGFQPGGRVRDAG